MILIPGTDLYKELSKLYVSIEDHWVWIGKPNTLHFEYMGDNYLVKHTVCTVDGLPNICINPNHIYPIDDKTIIQVCIYTELITYTKGATE